jgi:4-hydroxythreonine-4-phosphate dehydrogenase
VLPVTDLDVSELEPGRVSAVSGDAAYRFIEFGTRLALEGTVDGLVTAPLNKEALNLGGHHYPGHTQLLAELTRTPRVVMMLMCDRLKVSLVTDHVSLLDAVSLVRPELVLFTIRLTHRALRDMGVRDPRLGVAGLNPHAGESGLFGDEDERHIRPAIAEAAADGLEVAGPFPADTLFMRSLRGDFDAVVAMTHDQGLGPLKAVCFETGVNTTLGLPIIRTSPDHGTAFGRAWQWRADSSSMLQACHLAARLAHAKRRRSDDWAHGAGGPESDA